MNVVERFLKYVSFDTQSNEASQTIPSTAKQRLFGEYLVTEMQEIGLLDVRIDEYGYVYGYLPATDDSAHLPPLGLIAHMDTSPTVSGADVKARIVWYEGGELVLGNGASMSPEAYPMLAKYQGQELIVTDGSTLLGADDKAGIAEILSACAFLKENPNLSHRTVCIAFTPDEEIGCGADHFDVEGFGASVAYTVDGGELGEIEYENFNAATAKLTVKGVNIHPGSAKNLMKNAVLMANQWISMLPSEQTPAHTDGYEGFYHVTDMKGNESNATVTLLVRDHDREKFEERKSFLLRLTEYLNGEWGSGCFSLDLKDSYYNMKEQVLQHPELIENAKSAMEKEGVVPRCLPIRGGTDGARLSFMGIPCPNLSTGGANFHGVHEFIPTEAMEKMVRVLVRLSKV